MPDKPKLLSGGNPQIPKGEGDAPVQAYIDAVPGWRQEVVRRLDSLITKHVPDVRKAVKWNSPLYGIEGKGWFLSYHCMTKYVKVAFYDGESLEPQPPVASSQPNVCYVHLFQDAGPTDEQLVSWIEQAAKLPGWSKV